MQNFHVPLPKPLYDRLRNEAKRTAQPATVLVRSAIKEWLDQLEEERLHQEIVAYAKAHGGTEFDLDEDLEAAGIESMSEAQG